MDANELLNQAKANAEKNGSDVQSEIYNLHLSLSNEEITNVLLSTKKARLANSENDGLRRQTVFTIVDGMRRREIAIAKRAAQKK